MVSKSLALAALILLSACAGKKIQPVSAVQANHDRQVVNAVDAGDGDFELPDDGDALRL